MAPALRSVVVNEPYTFHKVILFIAATCLFSALGAVFLGKVCLQRLFNLPPAPRYTRFRAQNAFSANYTFQVAASSLIINLANPTLAPYLNVDLRPYFAVLVGLMAELRASWQAYEMLNDSRKPTETVRSVRRQNWLLVDDMDQLRDSVSRLRSWHWHLAQEVLVLFRGITLNAPGKFVAALVSPTTFAKIVVLAPSAVLTLAGMSTGDTSEEDRAARASSLVTGILSGALSARLSEGLWVHLMSKVTGSLYTDELAGRFGDFVQSVVERGFASCGRAIAHCSQHLRLLSHRYNRN